MGCATEYYRMIIKTCQIKKAAEVIKIFLHNRDLFQKGISKNIIFDISASIFVQEKLPDFSTT